MRRYTGSISSCQLKSEAATCLTQGVTLGHLIVAAHDNESRYRLLSVLTEYLALPELITHYRKLFFLTPYCNFDRHKLMHFEVNLDVVKLRWQGLTLGLLGKRDFARMVVQLIEFFFDGGNIVRHRFFQQAVFFELRPDGRPYWIDSAYGVVLLCCSLVSRRWAVCSIWSWVSCFNFSTFCCS